VLASVSLQQLSTGPLDGEEMKPGVGFTNLDRAHNIRMLNTGAVLGFPDKAGNGRTIVTKLLSEDL
jgi:hypothetical protein